MNDVIACQGDTHHTQELAQRFENLWQRAQAAKSGRFSNEPNPFKDIAALLSEPHRFYHGWCHLLDCLAQLDPIREKLEHPDAVELSLWFHDSIYDPRRRDNEQQSASWFRDLATGKLPCPLVETISDYIVLTQHRSEPADRDGAFVVDIDLSSLGADWHRFERDSMNLRKESTHLSNQDYNRGKRQFFEGLLQRPRIYFTRTFSDLYDSCARSNIKRYLNSLENVDSSDLYRSRESSF